ncbi:MAG TPA: protein kinase [Vicinamibacteria bacterium]|nr:protein kinase [Vicinamibacteria bacterium]
MGTGSDAIRIGRYEIRRELGRGVMGVVFEAWDPNLHRTIALKTIRPVAASQSERESWEARFLTEARAAARLSHPAIVVVHDVGRDVESGVLYLALEYLQGQTLADRLASAGPLPWREALRIVGRVAEGLAHAHAQGVVHRDVKPANIMLLPSGEPKILDFGVARLDAGSLTSPGDLCGTPLFMSPEQAAGEPLDARSDLFSLGAVAWALISGKSPFDAPSVPAILTRVIHRAPDPVSERVPGLPPGVDEVVARAMAKRPEERYPDGHALAQDIEDLLAERPPRHRAEWQPPPRAEQTIVSPLAADVLENLDLTPADLTRHPAANRSRPGRRWLRPLLVLALLGAAVSYFALHPEDGSFWRAVLQPAGASLQETVAQYAGRLEPVTPTPARPASTASPVSAVAASPPGAGAQPSPSPAATEEAAVPAPTPEAATPEPTAEAAATPLPSPSPSPAPARPRPPSRHVEAAYLSIGFEHGLKSGTLEVWVDGNRVAEETLDSRVTRKMLMLELRKGSIQRTLRLDAGPHRVSVRVRSGGETRIARTTANFGPGVTRRLEVHVSLLSQKLSLEWK